MLRFLRRKSESSDPLVNDQLELSGTVMESDNLRLLSDTRRSSRGLDNDAFAGDDQPNPDTNRPRDEALSSISNSSSRLSCRTKSRPREDAVEASEEGERSAGNKMASEKGGNCFRKCPPLRVVVTCVACFIVQFTLGVSYTNGNMLPYLTSYLRLRTDGSVSYAQTLWISAANTMSLAVSMPLLGLIENHLPPWAYRLLGIVLFCGSYLAATWAITVSFGLTVVCLGVLHGSGQALLYPACLNLVLQWLPKRRGLMGGLIMAGYGGGGFLWDQVVTTWINPHNLKPDVQVREDLYFSQSTVLDRVPTCYTLLGSVLLGVQILCLLCMSYPPPSDRNDVDGSDVSDQNVISGSPPPLPVNDVARIEGGHNRDPSNDAENSPPPPPPPRSSQSSPPESSPASDVPVSGTRGAVVAASHDYTPMELFRSRAMWTITIFSFFVDLNVTIVLNFYKAYGQTFVHNDRLLSIMASFGSVINAVCRPLWGMLADRAGFQLSLMMSQAILTFASAMLLVVEHGGAAMLFVVVSLLFLAVGGIYGTEYTMISVLFGSKHFTFNLGVFNFTGVVSALIDVYVVDQAKAAFGWYGIFVAAAAFSLSAMLINWSLACSCGHPLPDHLAVPLFQPPPPPVSTTPRDSEDTPSAQQEGYGACP